MTEPTLTDDLGAWWQAIADVRDAHPRHNQDASTDDILAALAPLIARMVADAEQRALRDAAESVMAYAPSITSVTSLSQWLRDRADRIGAADCEGNEQAPAIGSVPYSGRA